MKKILDLDKSNTFWAVLLVVSLWKILLAGKVEIAFDEGHYFYWSLFPQLSYFDHPPLMAWSMALIHPIFGDSLWTVRFWPLLVGILFPICGRRLARDAFSIQAANRAGILLTLCPVFAGNGFLMTPDVPLAIFWALALWITWKALNGQSFQTLWWITAGLCAGLGMLSKYTMVLYFLSLGVLFLIWPQKRKDVFLGTLICGLTAMIIFLPVIIWNLQNDWISFRFQLEHGYSRSGTESWKTFFEYIGILLLVATPLLGGLSFWSAARGFFARESSRRYMAVFFWTVVAFFAYSSLKSRVEANWPMFAFYSGIILAAADWPAYNKRLRHATLGLLIAVAFIGLGYLSLPRDFSISVAGKPLDISRMEEFYGGEELAAIVRERKEAYQVDFICGAKEIIVGEIAFYAPELRPLLWMPREGNIRFPWIDDRQWAGKDALLVSRRPRNWPWFEKVEFMEKIEIPFKKHLNRTVYIGKGVGYKPKID